MIERKMIEGDLDAEYDLSDQKHTSLEVHEEELGIKLFDYAGNPITVRTKFRIGFSK